MKTEAYKLLHLPSYSFHGASKHVPQYYCQWMKAFWRLLVAKGILSEAEMLARRDQFLSGHRQDVY